MKKNVVSIIILLIFFLLFAEQLNVANMIVAFIVAFFIYKMNRKEIDQITFFKFKTIPLWALYIVILFKEVLIANIQVAIIALSPKMAIQPHIVDYQSELKGEMFLTILANSITLTPGTMSVDIVGSKFKIHCLNENYALSLKGNIFEKMLLKIEGAQNE